MHWLDVTILVALGVGAAFGFWSGLLWQIARVLSLFASLYLAVTANPYLADWFAEHWKGTNAVVCRVIAFIVVFLAVYVTLYLLTRTIHNAIKAAQLETVDRVLGALLGMVKMAAIVSAICAGVTALGLPLTDDWMEQSTLAKPFARGTDLMVSLIPREYRDRLAENVDEARDQIQKKATDAALEAMKK